MLKRIGHRVILVDPNSSRLEVGRNLGADDTVEIKRGGGQVKVVRAKTDGGQGSDFVIECTGVPEVWEDAILSA